MTDEKKRRKKSKRFNFKSCFILVLAIYMLTAIINQQSQLNNLNTSIADTNAMIEEKQQEASEIDDASELYASDEFVERIARERLGFVRSDETVFVDVTGK